MFGKEEVDAEIINMVKKMELKSEDHEERVSICSNLHSVLIEAGYTNCLVYPYGSTLNGVGFTDSDLDLYVDLGRLGDPVKISEILTKCSDFANIEAVPNARVPIVKALHSPSGIRCDLSFGHKASLWNTEFIRFCCLVDPRVRGLIMVVRHWGKMCRLVGVSNYGLTMLVIGFLQQRPTPLLHSLHQLLHITPPHLQPTSFCSHLLSHYHQLPPLARSSDTISDLLLAFFNHYHSFDYSNNVISIFLGKTLNRKHFIVGNIVASKKPVCVQDPFELNFNIFRNMSETVLATVKCQFYEGAKKTRNWTSARGEGSFSDLFLSSTHSSALLNCIGCNMKTIKQPSWSDNGSYYVPRPGLVEYSLDPVTHQLLAKMPPWWRKWKGLC